MVVKAKTLCEFKHTTPRFVTLSYKKSNACYHRSRLSRILFSCLLSRSSVESFLLFILKFFTYGPTYPHSAYAPYAGTKYVKYQNLSLTNELNHMLAHVTYTQS